MTRIVIVTVHVTRIVIASVHVPRLVTVINVSGKKRLHDGPCAVI